MRSSSRSTISPIMSGRASFASNFNCTHHVFLNFRGETRYGFVGNLYDALSRKGIRTFMDDEGLQKGDQIMPKLSEAIQGSMMAIIVFSGNYATSTFSLKELVLILKYIREKGRQVVPIFYDVNLSDVKHQKGNYEVALIVHKNNFKADEEDIQNWKRALHDAASLSGYYYNPRKGYEYEFIRKIVEIVYNKVKCQNDECDSNSGSLTWDPMEDEYQLMSQQDRDQTRDLWLRQFWLNLFTAVASLCSS